MYKRWFLLKKFLQHPLQVGAIAPSGEILCRELTDWLELDKAAAAAELGPGTGVVTEAIIRRCNSKCDFFAVELDPEICRLLQENMPQVCVCNANACDLKKLCQARNIEQLDAVVSGLPWASFPASLQQTIIDAVLESLPSGGRFSTFAYLQGMVLPGGIHFRKLLKKKFSHVELSAIIWKNLPPAVVYRCIK